MGNLLDVCIDYAVYSILTESQDGRRMQDSRMIFHSLFFLFFEKQCANSWNFPSAQ